MPHWISAFSKYGLLIPMGQTITAIIPTWTHARVPMYFIPMAMALPTVAVHKPAHAFWMEVI